jgi:hypothetical protein
MVSENGLRTVWTIIDEEYVRGIAILSQLTPAFGYNGSNS